MYISLTKREVKMAGYWPSSLFAFLWTDTKSKSMSAFLLTGKTGENFAPDGTVQFFLQKKWNGSSCTI